MKPHRYNRVLSYALDHPWAITRPMLATIAAILARHHTPNAAGADYYMQRDDEPPPPLSANGVMVIPMHGVIAPRMDMFSDMSGGCTFEGAATHLREAVANADVGTVVFDWHSPGGSAAGATEFAAEVRKAREHKRIVSVANFEMCSAAYWVGAQAHEVVASPSAIVGSIGVYTIHEDLSAFLAEAGIKLTYIAAGKYKVDGNEAEPLSDSALAHMSAMVTAMYDRFVGDVAAGRNVDASVVRSAYGEGRALDAQAALAAGLVDSIATLDDTLARLIAPSASARAPIAATRAQQSNAYEAALCALAL